MPPRMMSLENLTKPKPLYPETNLVEAGRPSSAVVCPSDDRYAALAETIQKGIQDLSGAKLPIIAHTAAAVTPRRHLILLGNLNTNRAIFRLYGYSYTPADDHYPGNGGHLLHTIHDPWGNGKKRRWPFRQRYIRSRNRHRSLTRAPQGGIYAHSRSHVRCKVGSGCPSRRRHPR